MLDTDKLQRLIALDDERKDLEARIKGIGKDRKKLETELLEQFETSGMSSVKCNGKTVYLKRELWASTPDKAIAAKYLRDSGLGDYVSETFNTNSISAFVREMDANGENLPAGFLDTFKVSEIFKIQTRKG